MEAEAARCQAVVLEKEIQLRVLRRTNTLVEGELRQGRQLLEKKKQEMSQVVLANLRGSNGGDQARMVAVHEEVVALKRALQKERALKERVLAEVAERRAKLEALKQQAEEMDKSLREEESLYMSLFSSPVQFTAASASASASGCAAAVAAAAAPSPSPVAPSTDA